MMPATPRSSSIPQAAATSPNARCRVRSGMICRSRASSSASISAAVPTYRSETIFGRPPTRAISRKYQYVLPLIFFGYRLAINLGHTPEQPRGQAPNQRATSRNASASASHWASDNHDHRKLRLDSAEHAAQVLGWDEAALVQVDQTVPPSAPSGRKRPPTAARIRACDLSGSRLLDVVVRLVGPSAQHIPDGAVAPDDAAPTIHQALSGRRLIVWHERDLEHLRQAAPEPGERRRGLEPTVWVPVRAGRGAVVAGHPVARPGRPDHPTTGCLPAARRAGPAGAAAAPHRPDAAST